MFREFSDIEALSSFSSETLERLSDESQILKYSDGDTIFREGEEDDSLYIIKKGNVLISKEGRELSLFSEGALFGEMSVYGVGNRTADAACSGECELIKISGEKFRNIIFSNPSEGVNFLMENITEMARRLRRTSNYFLTVYETGRIVGSDQPVNVMAEAILNRLLSDIEGATGGAVLLKNQFSDDFITASVINMDTSITEKITRSSSSESLIKINTDSGRAAGITMTDDSGSLLGYLVIEKKSGGDFSSEEGIILSAVGNQVGLGITEAYRRKEEEDRKRLQDRKYWQR